MTLLKAFGAVAALCLVGAVGFGVAAWRSSIDPITPPETGSFDAALVKRGAELAAIGNCNVCHTAAGGRVYAGGAGLPTPFGTIYSTNITPDAETGIGRWSEAAFRRAMREGVDRRGRHLYPAFPYDHFTLVSDDDDKAPCVVAGPTCDSADVLYEKTPYDLPVTLTVGDEVLIDKAGAYTTTYASVAFNGFAPLKSYVI